MTANHQLLNVVADMPHIAYWFSGAAVAAFVVFVGAGYGWYRAAVSEMETANTSSKAKADAAAKLQEDAELKTRKEERQKQLGDYLVAGSRLMTRFYDAQDKAIEKDATDWNLQVMQYAQDHLGPAYLARVNTGTGVTGFLKSATDPAQQKVLESTHVRLIRLQEFLKELSS